MKRARGRGYRRATAKPNRRNPIARVLHKFHHKKQIEDFFTAAELVEYLQLPVEEIVDRFEDEIDDAIEDIDELMGVRANG